VALALVAAEEKAKIVYVYVYDVGDDWRHDNEAAAVAEYDSLRSREPKSC
jgi:hypothetical protein